MAASESGNELQGVLPHLQGLSVVYDLTHQLSELVAAQIL